MNLEELKRKYLAAVSKNREKEYFQTMEEIEKAVAEGKAEIELSLEFNTTISQLQQEGFKIIRSGLGTVFNISGWEK